MSLGLDSWMLGPLGDATIAACRAAVACSEDRRLGSAVTAPGRLHISSEGRGDATQGRTRELTRRVDERFAEDIGRRPGFVAYAFMDCGDGEIVTLSVFRDADQAEASRELARRWTEENLQDLAFRRLEGLRGEILVSRAAGDMLEPGHAGSAAMFASVRRYRLRTGSIGELMHIVDEVFADQIEAMDGFEAYHALDCGGARSSRSGGG